MCVLPEQGEGAASHASRGLNCQCLLYFPRLPEAGIDNEDPNVGPMPRKDYIDWIGDEEPVIVWPSNDSLLDEYVIELDPSVGGSSSQPPEPSP